MSSEEEECDETGDEEEFVSDEGDESKDYEKGCNSFAHLQTYLNHTRVNIKDPANANAIFRTFILLYFRGFLFRNSKSWDRLELLGPIVLIEKKGLTIDFGSAILEHLYYCLDQESKQELKYISGFFQLIEYQCYEYYQIGHHIFINDRLDDFWPRMPAWYTKRQKLMGNKAKHHLALMRQQLDLCAVNNMQWDPFKNMKDALMQEVIIAGYDFFAMTEGMQKLTLDRTLDLEARYLHDESCITHLTMDLRRAEYHLSQLNKYLDGEGVVVDWEDDEDKAGTSQVETSRGRVFDVFIDSSSEEEEEEDIDESSADYSDDDVIDVIKINIFCNQAEIDELDEAKSSRTRVGTDPKEHIQQYRNSLVLYSNLNHIICHMFTTSLQEQLLQWFHSLPEESIHTFDQLHKQLIKTYARNRDKEEKLYSLIGLKQSHEEKLEDFSMKFLELTRKVDNIDQKTVVTAFTNALWLDCKAKEYIFLNKLTTLEEMITKVK
ncbi:hypothetical protein GIB67_013029 [Kingdonia uniflora]|uniref:Retrotransposon gag domain-containing protein n=1 Tax=Kingdonia uniflora TaxID=39325 RepID=A0A7J7MCL2_9MAGN|nr:hypothetical protein GIB67_013029 [Kingdonia uniflora]